MNPAQQASARPRAGAARFAASTDAQQPTVWIAEYMEFHRVPPAVRADRPWDEMLAVDREFHELRLGLRDLQQRVKALEQR